MNKRLASVLAFGALFVPSLAAAQTVVYAPWTAPVYVLPQPSMQYAQAPVQYVQAPVQYAPMQAAPTTGGPDEARFRFGVGGNIVTGGGGDSNSRGGSVGHFGFGLSLDLGVQINRQLAVYAHGTASTIILSNQASLHGVIEYTPTDVISLGTGIGWTGMISASMGYYEPAIYCASGPCPTYQPPRDRWGGVSFPLIVGFNFARREGMNGRRKAFRMNVESTVGVEPSTGAFGWTAGLSFGYTAM